MVANHPECAKLTQSNITELVLATEQDNAWSREWRDRWEHDMLIAAEAALKLNTLIVVKFLKQIWTPFQFYYTSQ